MARPAAGAPRETQWLSFFDAGSSELTPRSQQIFRHAAETILRYREGRIWVYGHCDTAEAPREERRLSRTRATAVVAFLRLNGVTNFSVVIHAMGGISLLVPTEDNVSEIQNRRVEVFWGPPLI
ncbi:OmpA family protein [Muricoccus radiodurans]|uniref:OmpA family protein n=1 Tax=Muricoccus radiodurans TaxID=2231721 RepID=UPI003CEEDACB